MKASKIIFPIIGQPKDRKRATDYGSVYFWAKNGNMGFVRFDKSGELIVHNSDYPELAWNELIETVNQSSENAQWKAFAASTEHCKLYERSVLWGRFSWFLG